jgi:hypothetical protein
VTHRVHYVAAGRGLAFDCWRKEVQAHVASGKEVPIPDSPTGWTRRVYSVPMPLRHTSLDRVTCNDCWREIFKMARNR